MGLIFDIRESTVGNLSSYRNKPSKEDVFRNIPVPSALRIMILPSVISQLIVLIYNMADTFYVGQTHDPNMVAATSLILPVFNICLCLAGLAGAGGGSLISRLLGQGRDDEARRVGTFSIYLGLAIAALFAVLIGVFMSTLLGLLGADEDTYEYARQYATCVIVAGGIPTVLSNVLSNLLRSVGRSSAAGFGIILGGVLNIALDPIFMFVLLPDGKEVLGAGVATCLSNCIACIYFFIVLFVGRKDSIITFNPRVGMASRSSIAAVFAVGLPSAVTSFLFDMDYVILDKLMVSYDNIALAAIGIVLKVERFPLNVGVGICQGMMPLVGYNYSAGNRKRLRDTIHMSIGVGLVIAAISIVLYEIFAPDLVSIFLDDDRTVELAAAFLRVRVLATPLMFISFFTVYLFQALGKGNTATVLGVVRWLGFNIPMLYILNTFFGMYGLVWSQVSADILTVTVSIIVYLKCRPPMLRPERLGERG